ncbi:hypothetical protein [Reinekea marinisedimentorum]|uniref:DUF4239 domain-containing protein n=1 Tax=Reinekea marinisedimentorum TaxID=230495 RepID=A0A4R3I7T5_9GAMM|nr:hypothetical protein [Reinekea marinisedimentorum]TCS41272.1 hypothetical protein BCF53_1063 [Reinekea marinisedimentorum]
MDQSPFLFNYSSIVITVALFTFMVLFNEVGFHIGRFIQNRTDEEMKTLTGAIQASILGLLALLLSFTFSMSMQRYDNRSEALISEANSIGTAMLRVQLLPVSYRSEAHRLLQKYLKYRIDAGKVDLTQIEERKVYAAQIGGVQDELWNLAVNAAYEDPRPVTTGAFITSLNDMFDSQGKRSALLQMHVPEVVIYLLFLVFIASGVILGYSSGLSGRRVLAPTIMVSFLISLIVFIIIDLDRPRRGLIQVDQSSLVLLQQS